MDKRFLTAFIAPPYVDLVGFRLKPFCPRHILALHALDNPFADSNVLPSPAGTIQFLRVCSADKADPLKLKPGFLDSLFALKLTLFPNYHKQLIESILQYMSEYSSPPRTSKKSRAGMEVVKTEASSVPDVLLMVTFAMSKLGMSEDEALDAPIGKLLWYGTGYAIMEGAEIRILTTDAEEKAEEDKESILAHERAMKERLLKAMQDGKVPKRKVRTTSQ